MKMPYPGSDGSAAGGGYSDLSEWPRSVCNAAAPTARRTPGTATGGGGVDKDVCHSADEFAVLDDWAAGHADVKQGTKEFCVFLRFLCVFWGKRQVFTYLARDP